MESYEDEGFSGNTSEGAEQNDSSEDVEIVVPFSSPSKRKNSSKSATASKKSTKLDTLGEIEEEDVDLENNNNAANDEGDVGNDDTNNNNNSNSNNNNITDNKEEAEEEEEKQVSEEEEIKKTKKMSLGKKRKRSEKEEEYGNEPDDDEEKTMVKKRKRGRKKKEDDLFEVDEIIGWRYLTGDCVYHVKWKGYDPKDATWEPIEHVAGNQEFEEFVRKVQLQLVEHDESRLIETISSYDPAELKGHFIEKYWHGDNTDKLALQQIFKFTPKQDPQLKLT